MDNLIDGKAVAAAVRAEVAERTKKLFDETGIRAGLAVIIVGEDPASEVYVRNKHTACHEAGMHSLEVVMPAETTQAELEAKVDEVSADPAIHGLIVQMPLPGHLDTEAAIERIPFAKDADGLTSGAMGRLMTLQPGPLPCTPAGIQALLAHYGVQIEGRHVVIVGRGLTIGRPLANLLTLKRPNANAAVTVVHTGVADLGAYTREADIIVAAAGSPGLITADMVKPGAAVVAAGVSFEGKKLVSDVADEVAEVAGWLSPRIGGVGPMTRAMVLVNTVEAAERRVEQG